jgi:hypothetical protein
MKTDMPTKIPVSALVQVENVQLPPISKEVLFEKIIMSLKVGDTISYDGMLYRYVGKEAQ